MTTFAIGASADVRYTTALRVATEYEAIDCFDALVAWHLDAEPRHSKGYAGLCERNNILNWIAMCYTAPQDRAVRERITRLYGPLWAQWGMGVGR